MTKIISRSLIGLAVFAAAFAVGQAEVRATR
jgi:hypothetical protein